jgi:nitrate reductase delta subunit
MLLSDDELPDHLGVLLEFGATADLATARVLLLEHRAGLELLRLALEDAHSPWAYVLQAVSSTLPPLAGDDREAVAKLAAKGPPAEEVGLAPFAPPEFMPQTDLSQTRGGPVSLPSPTYSPTRTPANSAAKNGARA